jgi:hypothetical protein
MSILASWRWARARPARGVAVTGLLVALTAAAFWVEDGLARSVPFTASRSLNALAAAGKRRCAVFRVKRVRHGKLVRHRGKVVYGKRRLCVTVPAATCKVTWIKRRRHGRIVVKQHNPVWIAKVRCPTTQPPVTGPSPTKPPATQPTSPAAGPGNAAVAVYEVTAQGVTFLDTDTTGSLPAKSGTVVESFTQHGYLVHLLTPFPGLNGPAQDEVGLFLGSLIGVGETAGTTQFGTNTMMFTAANAGDPTIFQQLPFPYDIGQATTQNNELLGLADLQSIEQVTPPGGWRRTISSIDPAWCPARSRASTRG